MEMGSHLGQPGVVAKFDQFEVDEETKRQVARKGQAPLLSRHRVTRRETYSRVAMSMSLLKTDAG